MCNGEEGSFRVLVENEACGIVGHRCAKAITIFYKGGLIVMQHGEVIYWETCVYPYLLHTVLHLLCHTYKFLRPHGLKDKHNVAVVTKYNFSHTTLLCKQLIVSSVPSFTNKKSSQ